jgi:hypothetical protein
MKALTYAVKALEWTACAISDKDGLHVPFKHGIIVSYAPSVVGTYGIVKADATSQFEVWLQTKMVAGPFDTRELAVSAAQADFRVIVLSALASHTVDTREADGWMDIGTAPREGPAFLVWCPERFNVYLVSSDHDDDCWEVFGGRKLTEVPTHWRHLPPHPQTGVL